MELENAVLRRPPRLKKDRFGCSLSNADLASSFYVCIYVEVSRPGGQKTRTGPMRGRKRGFKGGMWERNKTHGTLKYKGEQAIRTKGQSELPIRTKDQSGLRTNQD